MASYLQLYSDFVLQLFIMLIILNSCLCGAKEERTIHMNIGLSLLIMGNRMHRLGVFMEPFNECLLQYFTVPYLVPPSLPEFHSDIAQTTKSARTVLGLHSDSAQTLHFDGCFGLSLKMAII